METVLLVVGILAAYGFGFVSGVIYEASAQRDKEAMKDLFRKDQKDQLNKTRRKKPIMPAGFGTFGPGNSNTTGAKVKREYKSAERFDSTKAWPEAVSNTVGKA
jgi:hypothetical protein